MDSKNQNKAESQSQTSPSLEQFRTLFKKHLKRALVLEHVRPKLDKIRRKARKMRRRARLQKDLEGRKN